MRLFAHAIRARSWPRRSRDEPTCLPGHPRGPPHRHPGITAHLHKDAAVSWCGADLDFTGVVFDGGDFAGAEFSGGTVSFSRAVFSGGEVDFSTAVFSGSTVIFAAVFSGGTVNFGGAALSGGMVSFGRAAFSGGTVEFYRPASWSSPPTFPWTDTAPSGVKLPEKEDRSWE